MLPTGPLPHYVFVKGLQPISSTLTLICNASITTATYKKSWKHATVLPLLKKPSVDSTMPAKYRLISMQPYPAKVLEKLFNKRLAKHL